MGTLRQGLRAAIQIDGSQFEGLAALRCTAGVAVVVVGGFVIDQPLVSAFGAIGAVSAGFGSFQGAYRSRAAVMIAASFGMALAVWGGSIGGHSSVATILSTSIGAFVIGMLVALGASASFVGLQCGVALIVASGLPADAPAAALRGLYVLYGGLAQTALVVMVWPLRRFSTERKSLAVAFRSLASYAASLDDAGHVAPEPHTFAAMTSPLTDPQPFARAADLLVFQALVDEAERIRASLAALATGRRRLLDAAPCVRDLAGHLQRLLLEIADALKDGRAPRERRPLWAPVDDCARQLPNAPAMHALLGQIRTTWRMAGVLTSPDEQQTMVGGVRTIERRPPLRDALTTLRANLTLHSTTFRHALRLSAAVAVAASVYRLPGLARGYWIPMTTLLVLQPEFQDTFQRAVGRVAGTILGAAFATLIVHVVIPGPAGLTMLVLAFVWGCYAFFRMNYALFATCLTGYVVFILMLGGVAEMTAATLRVTETLAGGVIAMGAYVLWPTWVGNTVRASMATMLEAHTQFVDALLTMYARPGELDLERLGQIRNDARLARSNVEAAVDRMLGEPRSRATFSHRTAMGLVSALRRHALAALALHAGLERGVAEATPGLSDLTAQLSEALRALAASVRSGTIPAPMPPLRQTHLALPPAAQDLVGQETDLMVDSINTMAEILSRQGH